MSVRFGQEYAFNSEILFDAGLSVANLYELYEEGADIVNASFCYCTYSQTHAAAIAEMYENGTIIIAGAGNGPDGTSCGTGHGYCYPASYDHVISVTSVSHLHPYGNIHPTYGKYAWQDCHEDSIDHPTRVHTHNNMVDLSAPGYRIATATLNDAYTLMWGTSFATPIVAGVCALILSENPSLSPGEVETILKSTSFDITNITENQEFDGLVGDGRVNAYAAVNAARESNASYSSLPYSTGFESGIDEFWTMYESHRFGRCVRSSDHSPHGGSYHITMDVIENNNYNRNEAWLHLDLSGKTNVELEFWWKENSDESHTEDGVFISDDGGDTFEKIYNLTGGSSTYSKVTIDLSNEISNKSMNHSSTFVIKFQQYDNYTMTSDGIAIDDINVCAKPNTPTDIIIPMIHCVDEWEQYYCPEVPDVVNYDWSIPGGYLLEDGTRYVQVRAASQGSYTLSVKAENICGQSSDWKNETIWIGCGLKMLTGEEVVLIYPNPANSSVTIEIDLSKVTNASTSKTNSLSVDIYDQYGSLVISDKTMTNSIVLNTGSLTNGTYFVRINYNDNWYTAELIVKH